MGESYSTMIVQDCSFTNLNSAKQVCIMMLPPLFARDTNVVLNGDGEADDTRL